MIIAAKGIQSKGKELLKAYITPIINPVYNPIIEAIFKNVFLIRCVLIYKTNIKQKIEIRKFQILSY
jgi:hypothetical protein